MSGRCIAMWSGPRNISTAMMRAWENRADTHVIDEPFYAHFLMHTGLDHPMREEIMATGDTDWRSVVNRISVPPNEGIFYQKHITTHWLEHYSIDWLANLDHIFLIREPEHVVASYAGKRKSLTASDLGYTQQAALFELIGALRNKQPVVLDSRRFLEAPASQLTSVCNAFDIVFDDCMLRWPAGGRDSDGIWAAHWYDAVNRSTSFAPPNNTVPALTHSQQHIVELCQPYYEAMIQHAI